MRRTCAVGVLALVTVACGSSEQEKQAEQVEKAAEQVQDSAASMAKGLEDMAKGLSAMAGGDPNAKAVDPVSFRDLQTVLPDLPGWEKSKPTGERMTMPVNFSQAEVEYTRGDSRIEAKIVDSALNQLLVAPFSMFLTAGYEKETSEGYEKSVKIGQYPGWEKWDTGDKDGELNAVVAGRFIVQLTGNDIADMKVLHDAMNATDLNKLASMR